MHIASGTGSVRICQIHLAFQVGPLRACEHRQAVRDAKLHRTCTATPQAAGAEFPGRHMGCEGAPLDFLESFTVSGC